MNALDVRHVSRWPSYSPPSPRFFLGSIYCLSTSPWNRPVLDQLLPFISRLMLIYYLVYAYRHFFLKRPTGIMRHGASKAFLGIYGHHFLWPLFCILYLPASRRARRTSPLSIMCPYCTYIISVYHHRSTSSKYATSLAPLPLIRRHPSPRSIPRAAYPLFFLLFLRWLVCFSSLRGD